MTACSLIHVHLQPFFHVHMSRCVWTWACDTVLIYAYLHRVQSNFGFWQFLGASRDIIIYGFQGPQVCCLSMSWLKCHHCSPPPPPFPNSSGCKMYVIALAVSRTGAGASGLYDSDLTRILNTSVHARPQSFKVWPSAQALSWRSWVWGYASSV